VTACWHPAENLGWYKGRTIHSLLNLWLGSTQCDCSAAL